MNDIEREQYTYRPPEVLYGNDFASFATVAALGGLGALVARQRTAASGARFERATQAVSTIGATQPAPELVHVLQPTPFAEVGLAIEAAEHMVTA